MWRCVTSLYFSQDIWYDFSEDPVFLEHRRCWAASSHPAQQEQSFIASILISRFLNKGTTDISFCLHTTSQFSVQQQESSRKNWGLYVCVILAMTCRCAFENTTKSSMSLGMAKSIQISWHHSTLRHPSSLMLNSFTSTVQLRCFGRRSAKKNLIDLVLKWSEGTRKSTNKQPVCKDYLAVVFVHFSYDNLHL